MIACVIYYYQSNLSASCLKSLKQFQMSSIFVSRSSYFDCRYQWVAEVPGIEVFLNHVFPPINWT